MVGKLTFSGLRDRLYQVTSHSSEEDYDPTHSKNQGLIKRHVPLIASPLDPKTTEWLQNKHASSNLTLKRRPTVAQQEASRVAGGIFRKQSEASPLELFFDLFFVANLSVFVNNHSHVTAAAVGNFIGFFSLMWSFWFHVAIHDVRFYVDSILNRFLKLSEFAIFIAFTGLSPIYDAQDEVAHGEQEAFRGLALVFMVSRLIFMLQYGVVLWFVRPFKKTILPLAGMMLIYLCSAMAFLGTYIQGNDENLLGTGTIHHVVVWYVIIGIEGLLVIAVSIFHRILSFKRTHLVERVGLLTLIIMGEGIIGIIKSISYVMDGTVTSIWNATGRVIPGVFLIYLIFVLYFTPIAHDRFGTVRQQFWVLLHYPLHVAILLTEEGSAQILIWTTVVYARQALENAFPSLSEPSNGFQTVGTLVNEVNNTMLAFSEKFTYLSLPEIYDWMPDLDRLQNLTSTFEYASTEFNEQAAEILGEMVNETTNFFFENFGFEGPEDIGTVTDATEKLLVYYSSMTVIFTYFYVCSGALLIVLAAMYWVGKNNKTWEEWLAIAPRAIVGLALPFISIAAYTQPYETGYMFRDAGWLITVTVFCYLFVSIMDNIVQNVYDKRFAQKLEKGEIEAGTLNDIHQHRYNGAFGPHIEPSLSHTTSKYNTATEKDGQPSNSKAIHFQERSDSTLDANNHNNGPGESDSLVSGDPTLSGRRESEQVRRKQLPTQQQQQLHPDSARDWQEQPTYHLPPVQRSTSGYGRMDTSYHGAAGFDVERGPERDSRNDPSFEQERMISPITSHDSNGEIPLPKEGHHRPEQGRQY